MKTLNHFTHLLINALPHFFLLPVMVKDFKRLRNSFLQSNQAKTITTYKSMVLKISIFHSHLFSKKNYNILEIAIFARTDV